ncbi:MAG: HupE/UreJ family protein [Cyanobacteria bacterium P01_E01_bin.6]
MIHKNFLRASRRSFSIMGFASICLALTSLPALAHHPFGGTTPSNALEGFLSGLGHPVIGIDHVVFVIAAGLLAAIKPKGFWIPIAFVLASLGGTGLHLMTVNLPAPEIIISLSVVVFGLLLATKELPHVAIIAGLGAIAGIFHGYAYGEAIVGAEMTPLIAYLAGFASVQLLISLGIWTIARQGLNTIPTEKGLSFRFAGFTILGIGAAFVSSLVV